MFKHARTILLGLAGLLVLSGLVYQIPAVQSRLEWRFEVWATYFHNVVEPVGKMPTPLPSTPFATFTPEPSTPTVIAAQLPTPTSLPPPPQASLPTPKYELQGINNCGPATLAMALRVYDWSGDQYDIAKIIKPVDKDRNVNPDELRYYVLNEAGWLRAEFRVAGNIDLIERLLAANYPVVIEEQSTLNPQDANGPNDDLWDAHYLLITGYDGQTRVVTAQDPLRGPDKKIPYDKLMVDWKRSDPPVATGQVIAPLQVNHLAESDDGPVTRHTRAPRSWPRWPHPALRLVSATAWASSWRGFELP